MNCKLGFIGVGKMGGAILEGVVSKNAMLPSEIGAYNPSKGRLKPYIDRGVIEFDSIEELANSCEAIIIAAKPQNFKEILPEIKKATKKDMVIVSVAAGITAKQIKEDLGYDAKVVLVMPNTPLLLGEGATAMARVEPTTEKEFSEIVEIFSCVSMVEEIPPTKLNEVIPVSGSSPAFIYLMADTIVNHAKTIGLDYDTAMKLFAQTLIGSGKMLTDSGYTPQQLIDMVSSPGGTTIEGLKALRENGFTKSLDLAFEACVKRAEELSQFVKSSADDVEIKIVGINSDYYSKILELRENILRIPIGLELTEQDLEKDKEAIHFAALKNGEIVGTGQLLPLDAFNIQMRQVAVISESRNAGVGRLIIKTMEDYARKENYSLITIHARKTAEGFYSALGYTSRGSVFEEKGIPHIGMYLDI